jgi:hypothetical protein
MSVTVVRSPCSAGDVAVTVTPGSDSPSIDWTTPVMVPVCTPCAPALDGQARIAAHRAATNVALIRLPFST